jgi:two-component system nitrate/nitrite response regulator NarL
MSGARQNPAEAKIRVLVADSSRIHTSLLANALRLDPTLEAIAFEGEPSTLVAEVVARAIDVLVISSNLDDQPGRGIEVLLELRALQFSARSVLLPESSKDEAILQAFRAGVRGIFGKDEAIAQLSKCVRCVHRGQVWANSEALRVAVEALASSPTVRAVNANGMKLLSDRELQVVRCIAEGLTNREIAARLKLSQHTIKNYLFRIFDKVGVSSRVELLFMTLSQNGAGPAWLEGHGNGHSKDEAALLKEAADGGLPAAQLALAQLYLSRGRDPQDLVNAYTWFLVATERAFQARGSITGTMTAEQIEEAKQKASVWLTKLKQIAPSLAGADLDAETSASAPDLP